VRATKLQSSGESKSVVVGLGLSSFSANLSVVIVLGVGNG
jgi:hypothetical protein